MADKKISELTAITGSNTAATDVFVVVDTSTGQTKKITREELNNAIEQDVLSTVDINGGTIDGTTIGATTAAAGSFTTVDATGNITVGGTVDGRDVATDGTKLDGIEASATADQTGAQIATALNGETISSLTALTTTGAVIVGGDFTVNGTTTTINSTTLDVDDKNIVLASGAADAAAANGSGITIDGASATFTYVSTGDKWQLNKPLDVTGAVTADGLTVDGDVSVNTGAGTITIDSFGAASAQIESSGAYKHISALSSGYHLFEVNSKSVAKFNNNGDISFYEDTGTTAKLFWDASAEALGIGDTAPVTPLTIATTNKLGATFTGTTNGEGLTVTQTDYTAGNYISLVEAAYDDGGDTAPNVRIGAMFDGNGSNLAFGTSNSYGSGITNTAMFIDSSGNVGIGTSSPSAKLTISGTGVGAAIDWVNTTASTGRSYRWVSLNDGTGFAMEDLTAGGAERLRIDNNGNAGLGTVPPSTYWGTGNNVGLFTGLGYLGSNGNFAVSLYSNGYRNSSGGFTYLDINGNTATASGIDLEPNGLIKFRNGTASGTLLPENMRLETDGDLHVDGNVVAYSTTISDIRLKKDIAPIENAVTKVQQLNGCTFTYLKDDRKSAGLIAQDVEKVLPSAVIDDEAVFHGEEGETYKTVQYDQVIGLLVEAVKELKAEIEELKNGTAK